MKQINPRLPVDDMLRAIAQIEEFTAGFDRDRFEDSDLVFRAVERCVEVISEASRRLPDDIVAAHADVPWRKIRGIGNVLRHEYGEVDREAIWIVVVDHLPVLKAALTLIESRLAAVTSRVTPHPNST
jgi:uncharacterized protein with HEPN domain